MRPMRLNFWLGLASAGVLAGCASSAPQVRVDKISGALPNCQTFAWNPGTTGDATSLNEQRVRTAVMQTLESKGYTQSDKPDCRIAYQLATHENPQAKPRVGVGVGGGSGGVGGGVGISLPIGKKAPAQAGTFVIDVIDANKNAQVWSGAVDAGFASTDISDEEARQVVEKILAEYPDRT